MSQIYLDRWGRSHHPASNSVFKKQVGAFLILHHDNKILFNHPEYAPDVPDLPGGRIDEDENIPQAVCRELKEEAELDFSPKDLVIDRQFSHNVHFSADDQSEYWDYQQTFLLVTQNIEALYFEGKKKVYEGHSEWIALKDLSNHSVHYMHCLALQHFCLIS